MEATEEGVKESVELKIEIIYICNRDKRKRTAPQGPCCPHR